MPIPQSSKRVVFDANVLINAYLAPPSKSAEAIKLVIDHKIRGLICLATVEEATDVLKRYSQEVGIDLHSYFQPFLRFCRIIMIKNPQLCDIQKVDKRIKHAGDRYVVATAKMIGASICTNDIEDINPESTNGLVCQTPGELTFTGEMTASSIVKGVLSRPDRGCIAVQFKMFIGKDDFKNTEPVSTGLLEVPGLCSINLVTGPNLITVQFINGPYAELPIEEIFTRDNYPITTFISYDCRKHLNLVASSGSGQILSNSNQVEWECPMNIHSISKIRLIPNPQYPTLLGFVALYLHPLSLRAVKRLLAGKTTDIPLERISVAEMIELFHSM